MTEEEYQDVKKHWGTRSLTGTQPTVSADIARQLTRIADQDGRLKAAEMLLCRIDKTNFTSCKSKDRFLHIEVSEGLTREIHRFCEAVNGETFTMAMKIHNRDYVDPTPDDPEKFIKNLTNLLCENDQGEDEREYLERGMAIVNAWRKKQQSSPDIPSGLVEAVKDVLETVGAVENEAFTKVSFARLEELRATLVAHEATVPKQPDALVEADQAYRKRMNTAKPSDDALVEALQTISNGNLTLGTLKEYARAKNIPVMKTDSYISLDRKIAAYALAAHEKEKTK